MYETMIDNQGLDTSMNVSPSVNRHSEEYNYCKPSNEQKFYANWSPQEDSRYFSKRRFTSPRILSKSVPRRNKTLMRYKINRSLNFDLGHCDMDSTVKSSGSSSDSICFSDDRKLTRSAKIMKALNFNYSPFHNQTKKIKKSLNFDLSPSPKQVSSKSPRDISHLSLNTPSPKLSRTLNFDTTTSSTPSSILLTSSESIDENQNQTPSHRNRSVKKSLNYLTPGVNKNMRSPDQLITSPLLRIGLKEKIDNIVQISATPNLHSLRKSKKKLPIVSNITISTPRNLLHDFSDEDGDRSSTPENMIRIIPESMSAIKKSHRKERLSRQIEHSDLPQIRIFSEKMDSFTDESMDSLHDAKRSSTPPMSDKYRSPTYDVNSIKQSHKKDKTKKKLLMPNSDDELSDTGSIFDYHMEDEIENVEKEQNSNNINQDASDISICNSTENAEQFCKILDDEYSKKETNLLEKYDSNDKINMDLEENKNVSGNGTLETKQNLDSEDRINANVENRPLTPETLPPLDDIQRVTPKNHINYVQLVLAESIKKSHRKVKDENRKRIFKPESLHSKFNIEQTEESEGHHPSNDASEGTSEFNNDFSTDNANANRACTPENVNSSRLLLGQYSSVKKSHKKDKHNKILSGFIKRQKYLGKNADTSNDKESIQYESVPCNLSGTSQHNSTDESKKSTECKLNISDNYEGTPSGKLSPSKRKKLSDELFLSDTCLLDDPKSHLLMDKSAEEEFRIFTPIKKRRALVPTTMKCLSPSNEPIDSKKVADETVENTMSICTTPVISRNNSSSSEGDFSNKNLVENNENQNLVLEEDLSMENPNGRSTPKNMSTSELLHQINSIKKSHKKDKRGNGLRKPIILSEEELYVTAEIGEHSDKASTISNTYLTATSCNSNENSNNMSQRHVTIKEQVSDTIDGDNPGLSSNKMSISTDSIKSDENADISLNVTPPNCLKTKTYIRLLQTASIKRSHKKVRDQKKNHLVPDSAELSDDGSIFDEEDRINSPEESNFANKKGKRNKGRIVRNADKTEFSTINSTDELQHFIGEENLSDDGSIFDANEKAEEILNSLNEAETRGSSNMNAYQ